VSALPDSAQLLYSILHLPHQAGSDPAISPLTSARLCVVQGRVGAGEGARRGRLLGAGAPQPRSRPQHQRPLLRHRPPDPRRAQPRLLGMGKTELSLSPTPHISLPATVLHKIQGLLRMLLCIAHVKSQGLEFTL
jgi:hypothetical protein